MLLSYHLSVCGILKLGVWEFSDVLDKACFLKFPDNIHYKFKSSQASKARLQSSKHTGAKKNLTHFVRCDILFWGTLWMMIFHTTSAYNVLGEKLRSNTVKLSSKFWVDTLLAIAIRPTAIVHISQCTDFSGAVVTDTMQTLKYVRPTIMELKKVMRSDWKCRTWNMTNQIFQPCDWVRRLQVLQIQFPQLW